LITTIIDNTHGHYDEHLAAIRALLSGESVEPGCIANEAGLKAADAGGG
jgi:hypothetical protein